MWVILIKVICILYLKVIIALKDSVSVKTIIT